MSFILPYIKDVFIKDSPGVTTACVYTSGMPSATGIKILSEEDGGNFYVNYADGDGFATKKSLNACSRWDISKLHKVTTIELENPLDLSIYSLPSLKRNLKEFIDERNKE